MDIHKKLTKKQRKGVAFRERKAGQHVKDAIHAGGISVPVMEDQDISAPKNAPIGVEDIRVIHEIRSSGKEKEAPKKRKRDADMDVDVQGLDDKTSKKQRRSSTSETGKEGKTEKQNEDSTPSLKPVKQRLILFIGNLKYTTSLDTIRKHFSACDPPPVVRLLTPKTIAGKTTNKSKGCAFLEFTHRNALQQALKLHQTELDGRMINVELTAGGGGRGERRLEKLKERNKQLLGQRQRIQKAHATDEPALPDGSQRYSATSGANQAVLSTPKTWSVGDVDKDNKRHRGKTRTGSAKRHLSWGTGVNAIPIG